MNTLKKSLILTTLLTTLTACGGGDEGNSKATTDNQETPLEGTWQSGCTNALMLTNSITEGLVDLIGGEQMLPTTKAEYSTFFGKNITDEEWYTLNNVYNQMTYTFKGARYTNTVASYSDSKCEQNLEFRVKQAYSIDMEGVILKGSADEYQQFKAVLSYSEIGSFSQRATKLWNEDIENKDGKLKMGVVIHSDLSMLEDYERTTLSLFKIKGDKLILQEGDEGNDTYKDWESEANEINIPFNDITRVKD